MQNMDHAKLDVIELTDADLDAINGGNCIGDFFRSIGEAVVHAVEWAGHEIFGGLQGPGNLRGPFGPGPHPF
jgi:hypothetical protein